MMKIQEQLQPFPKNILGTSSRIEGRSEQVNGCFLNANHNDLSYCRSKNRVQVTSDILASRHKVKGVMTRGGKMISQVTYDKEINETNLNRIKPPKSQPYEQDKPKEVMVEKEPPNTLGQSTQPPIKPQLPPVPFPNRLRKENEEAQQ
ncbi:hypothetical protein Tco_0890325 [Tanacetum coccineum]|uniref:Uncharacterized protein n=1 Tax=Tanacetum coccineum TaxID=301880 RepID=A0ABQ5C374_9ASTR